MLWIQEGLRDVFNQVTDMAQNGCMPGSCKDVEELGEVSGFGSTMFSVSWPEMVRDTEGLTALIGSGEFNTAYYFGHADEDGIHAASSYAVKVYDRGVEVGFERDVQKLTRIKHRNIARVLGYSTEDSIGETSEGVHSEAAAPARREQRIRTFGISSDMKGAVIYEVLPGDDAQTRLKTKDPAFGWAERLQTAIEVSEGLSYLHKLKPPVFHGDIKTSNILFTADGVAKLTDFDIPSAPRPESSSHSHGADNIASASSGYICPERVRSGIVDQKTEVYSYGMVVIELLTGRSPLRAEGEMGSYTYLLECIRPELSSARERTLGLLDPQADWPWPIASDLTELSLKCIHADISERPEFSAVAGSLLATQLVWVTPYGETVAKLCTKAGTHGAVCRILRIPPPQKVHVDARDLTATFDSKFGHKFGKNHHASKRGSEPPKEIVCEASSQNTPVALQSTAQVPNGLPSPQGQLSDLKSPFRIDQIGRKSMKDASTLVAARKQPARKTSCPNADASLSELVSLPEDSALSNEVEFRVIRTCRKGHELERHVVPREEGYRCDNCSRNMRENQILFGCRKCNYDVCESCSSSSPPPPVKEEKRETRIVDLLRSLF
eukprot:TRINITY_DN69740_c0_g1_i1.p1 TRINITY_DN69740_c0_g1~~TRINITY_DN69740_c0_g1_i1.p1  ORF type:complete len:609 (+),score=67.97 TRINITY_DN69740_c0_g1_i1:123-1949(+)